MKRVGKPARGRRKGYPNGYVYECRMAAGKKRSRALLAELTLEEKLAQVQGDFPAGGIRLSVGESIRASVPNGDRPCEHAGNALHGKRSRRLPKWQRTVQRIVMSNSPHHIRLSFTWKGSAARSSRIPQAIPPAWRAAPGGTRNWRKRLAAM